MKHLIDLSQVTARQLRRMLDLGGQVKSHPEDFAQAMSGQTLCMLFEKPSLRTRVSFETGVTQMGGHAIFYDLGTSPFGAGKESIADTARTLGRYVDMIMARLFEQAHVKTLAKFSGVPVINGLTNDSHPTQVLADLLTMEERMGALEGRTLAYLGDARNNVTHSLISGCALMGISMRIACPEGYAPDPRVLARAERTARKTGAVIRVMSDPIRAVEGADAVYTDTWMSYHIPPSEQEERARQFRPYQVNAALMRRAGRRAMFLHCLPAQRGCEVTDEVMDGPQSAVFDEAENRLHMHKAAMLWLIEEQG
ncbi:MAG: ornithine carbamoyltransferase [Kiritimatiellae bacterium]|nr:ornithine carbamoyltransferase [Kiritimatiellia bacterium]